GTICRDRHVNEFDLRQSRSSRSHAGGMLGTAHAGQQSPDGYEGEATVYPACGFLAEALVEAEKPYQLDRTNLLCSRSNSLACRSLQIVPLASPTLRLLAESLHR